MRENNNENFFNKFKSSKPKNLAPEEEDQWDREDEWNKQEHERRKKEGFYDSNESEGIVSKIKRKLSLKSRKNNSHSDIGYIS